jgi:hypothetical protein
MRVIVFSLLFILLCFPIFPKEEAPDIVIIASILPGGEDIGIAFSSIVPHNKVRDYAENLARLGGRNLENITIKDEENITSAHIFLKGGKQWKDDKQYIQLFINAFPDLNSLHIVLFPLREIENSLPLQFENKDVIIKSLGMKSFNYEVIHKSKISSPISLSTGWEKWRLPIYFLISLSFLIGVFFFLGRRRKQ